MIRLEKVDKQTVKLGRPESIPSEVRWKLRQCYLAHYGQWGPSVLRFWAMREGLGTWSAGTIARVIADLVHKPEQKAKPRRYEIMAPMVMWAEDGTAFKENKQKKELLVVQDECSRYKTGWRLANGPAKASLVAEYLSEAFMKYGAPLVLKHDGDSIFHDRVVQQVLDKYHVLSLTSPAGYPPFNGKKERSMRDIKSYQRALQKHGVGSSLEQRIGITMHDLNDERPRPVLGGRTAREVFEQDRISLPIRKRFKMEVETRQIELEAQAGSRHEFQAARRKAVVQVLSRYKLLKWRGDVSTYFYSQMVTN
jgi:transposase InsO family protein